MLLTNLLLIFISLLGVAWPIILLIMQKNKNDKKEVTIAPNKDVTKIFFNQLKKMIQYEVIYMVDSGLGNSMSQSNGASADLTNEEIYNIYSEVCVKIESIMSDAMKMYLYDNFGEKWIQDFIKIYTMSMMLNYANLSISSISMAKK